MCSHDIQKCDSMSDYLLSSNAEIDGTYLSSLGNFEWEGNKITITDGTFFALVEGKCTPDISVARCLKCEPKVVEVRGRKKSSSNFISHLRRIHGNQAVDEYKKHLESKRKGNNLKYAVKNKETASYLTQSSEISQKKFEEHILKFVVHAMVPFSVVENHFFKEIFSCLNISSIGLEMISKPTLCRNLEKLYETNVRLLKDKLKNVESLCTTLDVWSGDCFCFLGVTVHWINQDLLRESAALACRRIYNRHSLDEIGQLMFQILCEFEINSEKIKATVTDNARNSIKAFETYGVSRKCLTKDEEETEESDLSDYEEDELINVSYKSDALLSVIPGYVRCYSYTLNLCASFDLLETIKKSESLLSIHNNVMNKCNLLWSAVKSHKFSESLHRVFGVSLPRPIQTRWKSLFDALEYIMNLKENIVEVFQLLELKDPFTSEEFKYIKEHLQCMKPVVRALDILQGEGHKYYGILVPTLMALRLKLEKQTQNEWAYCKPLAESLLNSLNERFKDMFTFETSESVDAAIAALSHPQFKKKWFPCVGIEMQTKLIKLLKECVALELNPHVLKLNNKSHTSELMGYCDIDTNTFPSNHISVANAEIEMMHFFSDVDHNLNMLNHYPGMKNVFVKYNTPLPSSGAFERVFSHTTMLKAVESGLMLDEYFEMRMVLNANLKLIV